MKRKRVSKYRWAGERGQFHGPSRKPQGEPYQKFKLSAARQLAQGRCEHCIHEAQSPYHHVSPPERTKCRPNVLKGKPHDMPSRYAF